MFLSRFGRKSRETGIYIARVSQRLPWDRVEEGVRHGVGEHWYFHDALRNDPKYVDDKPFQYSYVQYLSNFIRTGDPNSKIIASNKSAYLLQITSEIPSRMRIKIRQTGTSGR